MTEGDLLARQTSFRAILGGVGWGVRVNSQTIFIEQFGGHPLRQ